jgi:hypothetical protein
MTKPSTVFFVAFLCILLDDECLGQQIKDLPIKTVMKSIQSSKNVNPSWIENENATLLDIFGEVSKDILTNQLIPATTAACDWDWIHFRCEPFCDCSYQALFGDYHLGRSCRSRQLRNPPSPVQNDSEAYNENTTTEDEHFLKQCKEPPNAITYKCMNGLRTGIKFIWFKINWRTRVEKAKHKVCDSLYEVERRENLPTNGLRDVENQSLIEKPVRAIRKSLHCDEILVNVKDSGDETTLGNKIHKVSS